VKALGSSSDEEFVAVFLLGELGSPRYSDNVLAELDRRGLDKSLISTPDLDDRIENEQRADVLLAYRPLILDDDVLGRWPPDIDWEWVELDLDEIGNLHYLTYSYWDELSNGTHLVRTAAENVRDGNTVFDVSNDTFWDIAHRIDAREPLPPLIARTRDDEPSPLLIEGHKRATSYLLAKNPPPTVKVLLALHRRDT
jgi:hypothetical protein